MSRLPPVPGPVKGARSSSFLCLLLTLSPSCVWIYQQLECGQECGLEGESASRSLFQGAMGPCVKDLTILQNGHYLLQPSREELNEIIEVKGLAQYPTLSMQSLNNNKITPH